MARLLTTDEIGGGIAVIAGYDYANGVPAEGSDNHAVVIIGTAELQEFFLLQSIVTNAK